MSTTQRGAIHATEIC